MRRPNKRKTKDIGRKENADSSNDNSGFRNGGALGEIRKAATNNGRDAIHVGAERRLDEIDTDKEEVEPDRRVLKKKPEEWMK